jgi:dienelactone hydrolase
MSHGGRTVLAALRTTLRRPAPFVAGVALYPGCQTDVRSTFAAPLLVLIGHADTVTPAYFCAQMYAAQPASAPELRLVIYPRGPHTFDMPLPERTVLGMRLGDDPQADADARRQVMDFLAAHGLAASHASR